MLEHLAVARPRLLGVAAVDNTTLKLMEAAISGAGKAELEYEREWLQVIKHPDCRTILGSALVVANFSEITAVHCTLHDNAANGVHAIHSSIARLSVCASYDNTGAGFSAQAQSMLIMNDCSSSRCNYGPCLRHTGPCSVSNCIVQHCGTGILVQSPVSDVSLWQCAVQGSNAHGCVVTGNLATVHLVKCTFQGLLTEGQCALYIAERGNVVAEECCISRYGVGAFAKDPETHLKMQHCAITCSSGLIVEEEAQCNLEYCEASSCKKVWFEIRKGASASLLHCCSLYSGIGVLCYKAQVVLQSCQALHCCLGAVLDGETTTTVSIRNSIVSSASGHHHGLYIKGPDVAVDASDCEFIGALGKQWPLDLQSRLRMHEDHIRKNRALYSKPAGISVHSNSGKCHFVRCKFAGHGFAGVHCLGADVHVQHSHSAGNQRYGFLLHMEGSMRIEQSSSFGDNVGCSVLTDDVITEGHDNKDTSMSLHEVFVHNARQNGFEIDNATNFTMKNCHGFKCGECGIKIVGRGGRVSDIQLTDSVFQGNGLQGALVEGQAHVTAINVASRGNEGAGFGVDGSQSQLHTESCESTRNRDPDWTAEGGTLTTCGS